MTEPPPAGFDPTIAARMQESEPAMLGASAHLLVVGRRPAAGAPASRPA